MQTRYPPSILEEELKNKVAADFFGAFDCSRILGKVDFCAAVCHSIEADWLNDRDQFLYPSDGWRNDFGFQRDCLVYTLFSDFNVIKSRDGVNHWIPFTEEEVGAKDCFASHFMSDFINGRAASPLAAAAGAGRQPYQGDLFAETPNPNLENPVKTNSADSAPLRLCVKERLSPAARAVLDAGRELVVFSRGNPGVMK